MAGVTRINQEESPTWERVKAGLQDLKHEKTLCLDVDDDTWLIVMFVQDAGYLVTGCGVGDRDYFTLIDRTLGDDIVTAFDGGNTNDHPRYAFVGEPLLLKAIEHFFLTGERDLTCEWVKDRDAVY